MFKRLYSASVWAAHLLMFLLLTIVTQIGGLVYLLSLFTFRKSPLRMYKRLALFLSVYLFCALLLVPMIAPFFGRVQLPNNELIQPRNYFYMLANRSYVRPELKATTALIADNLSQKIEGIQLIYLDANFPFIDGFPLFPHLSHNDGKKLDVAFIYSYDSGEPSNEKPSRSGYGAYEDPLPDEINQIERCISAGYWQYDFPQYLTGGISNPDLLFNGEATKLLCELITGEPKVGKLFIEPHLKQRLKLLDSKVRFHGCQAVRHDDHIHFQLN